MLHCKSLLWENYDRIFILVLTYGFQLCEVTGWDLFTGIIESEICKCKRLQTAKWQLYCTPASCMNQSKCPRESYIYYIFHYVGWKRLKAQLLYLGQFNIVFRKMLGKVFNEKLWCKRLFTGPQSSKLKPVHQKCSPATLHCINHTNPARKYSYKSVRLKAFSWPTRSYRLYDWHLYWA